VNGAATTRTQEWLVEPEFDLEAFLARPLVARVAAAGPTIRPVWYLWEEQAFWWLTGRWSRLASILRQDPEVAIVVDTCDLRSGEVLQVVARGSAEILALDEGRARRKLGRYLGPDEASRDRRFIAGTFADPSVRLVRVAPRFLRARDLSFRPAPWA
jgi:nitroimidazol reductase NimA-like FMN-containing flavoprotein (pyridoxamine 5'-phosphate oxidase superfamily)